MPVLKGDGNRGYFYGGGGLVLLGGRGNTGQKQVLVT